MKRLLVLTVLLIGFSTSLPAPPINREAQAVAKAFPNSSLKGGNVNSAAGQMQKMLTTLNKTGRNSRSSLQSVMGKAMDFRKDIGPNQKAATTNAVLNAWDLANDYGAFDQKGAFTGRANGGRYDGQKLIFENIVPASVAPEFSGYIGNLRLVPEDRARSSSSGKPSLSLREQGYLVELRNIQNEYKTRKAMLDREKSKVDRESASLDRKAEAKQKEQEAKRYAEAVKAAGDAVNEKPTVRLIGQRMSSPSKINGNRYRVRFEISNLSRHPTEIEFTGLIVRLYR